MRILDPSLYTWIRLNSTGDLSKLSDCIPAQYAPDDVGEKLSVSISDAVKAVLVEHRYTDKDYRSTYYHFYAKKGQYHSPDCVRLHFFDGAVTFDEERLQLKCPDRLPDHYFGYMVLRPTGVATIGRTILSPDVRSGACRVIITADHKAHVLGHKLLVQGFPSMDQHVDIAVCAHVACWSILRHYSERYSVYREFLTHDITMMAQDFDPGGLVPALGLSVSHAERVFQEADTYPLHISKKKPEEDEEEAEDPQFYRQLGAYIESGFPLFAAMHDKGHAVALVGLERGGVVAGSAPGMRYSWDEVTQLAVVDDNHLPYISISTSGEGDPYSVTDIDAFIVALPEKIFYPADAVDRLAPALFKLGEVIGVPAKDESVVRYFITTAASLRQFVRERESEFNPELLRILMTLPLTQFVWVVELSTRAQWAIGQVSARAIIDATASIREVLPLWLYHTDSRAIVMNRKLPSPLIEDRMSTIEFAGVGHSGFSRMERNLRPTVAK